jgi:hypothetical protein
MKPQFCKIVEVSKKQQYSGTGAPFFLHPLIPPGGCSKEETLGWRRWRMGGGGTEAPSLYILTAHCFWKCPANVRDIVMALMVIIVFIYKKLIRASKTLSTSHILFPLFYKWENKSYINLWGACNLEVRWYPQGDLCLKCGSEHPDCLTLPLLWKKESPKRSTTEM